MGEGSALASALCFGLTDIFAGLLARRVDSAAVALVGQAAGTALMLAAAPWVFAPDVSATALGWGALSGVGTGLGAAYLFRVMGIGRFSIVVPLSVVAGIALPVLAGVALLDDRPGALAWVGIGTALPALWLTTRSGGMPDGVAMAGLRPALVSGAAFALQYTALAQADTSAGLWPLVVNRAVSALVILPLVLSRPARLRMRVPFAAASAATGVVSMAAITAFALAGREQMLSTTVVLTSMYPVVPVFWGLTALHERLTRSQVGGLLCAVATVVLISLE
ncbi:DMT family transporter [Allosalinactinospora lopnorensis]|uniref:DMT family transporter n=1 Tax=Allosalinactinospora lopnorensis TaxID=1352348 RepID=UPI000623FC76|nr:DMT family transporter [Allosalinactinospora lopnorensis]